MTIKDLFKKHGITLYDDDTVMIDEYKITVYYDSRIRSIVVANDYDGLHEQCITPSQAVDAFLNQAEMIADECFKRDCRQIADECAEDGYPSHGSNYDLRVESMKIFYDETYYFIWNRR